MQVFKVIRGCLLAIAVATVYLTIGGTSDFFDGSNQSFLEAIFSVVVGTFLSMLFVLPGALIAAPFVFIAIGTWFLLALRQETVSYWFAILYSGFAFGLFGYRADTYSELLEFVFYGGIFGALFWLGAFGVQRNVTFSLKGSASNSLSN